MRSIARRKPRTLRQALAWLLIGALVPLLLASSVFLWKQWDSQHEASINRLRAIALALQLSTDREIALQQIALQVLANSDAIDKGDWEQFYVVASEAAKLRPESWVVLGAPSGRTLVNTAVAFGTPLPDLAALSDTRPVEWEGRLLPSIDRDVILAPVRTGRARVGNLFYGPVVKGPVIGISVPVVRHGETVLALAFAYPPQAFVKFVQTQAADTGVLTGIVDGNGLYIARNIGADAAVARKAPVPFDRGGTLAAQGVVESTTLDGVPTVFAHRRSELSDWTVVAGMPAEQLVAPAIKGVALWIALLVMTAAVAIALAYWFWRSVAHPLLLLARETRVAEAASFEGRASNIEELETLREALREAAKAERARMEEASQRIAAEERELAVMARHAEEMRTADRHKDEFLAMLGHELRNPLAPLKNALVTMRKIMPDDRHLRDLQAMMERQTTQLSRLVDDMLDVTRINSGKVVLRKQRLELSELARHAAELVRPLMNARGHTFSVDQAAQRLWIEADDARLSQVLGNLLENAAKYTPRGGNVNLSIARESGDAVIRVVDNGKGIRAELLPSLFELFTQDERLHEGGLGIGLYVVKRLVEAHGGTVSATSDGAGKGSVFTVRLPLSVQPEEPDEAPSPVETVTPLRILIVDDNRDAADSLAMVLRSDGHTVRTAYDGKRALEDAKQQVPDVVLIDIGMPIMNGYELARRLRSEPGGREVTVIAVSGFSQPVHERRAEEAAIDLHLTKPVDLDELERALARAGRVRHNTSEPEAQMMFNSPLQYCPVVKAYVALDQTEHQCAVEQRCEVSLRCPLHALFSGTSSEASESGAGPTPDKQSTPTEGPLRS